ncbi:hypothetical protein LV82_01948 [Albidovulum inexpectatum]|uniref:Uncharacterized protein n=1 Tax=Albidovulum inexpectatum TaxID=196587 RepID=A0A2S5JGQ0_9RHOB|nr:hypothetical protein [Albidovulum inexpectatum]PPB80599.1 hypothetical protein LV82_01948 [Albidovulum inexpectatum]
MVDRNLQNFYGRVARIERIHASGGGFEAEGAIGRSYYTRKSRPLLRRGVLGPVVLVLMTIVVIKAAVLASIGDVAYADRLERLRTGSTIDRVGAYVLTADPLTVMISRQLDRLGL